MRKEQMTLSKFSSEDTLFLCLNTFEKILGNENRLTKGQVCAYIRNLDSTLRQYS